MHLWRWENYTPSAICISPDWQGGGIDTVVTFTLKSVPEGTHLTLEHSGFEGIKGFMVAFALGRGWKTKILRQNLVEVLKKLDS